MFFFLCGCLMIKITENEAISQISEDARGSLYISLRHNSRVFKQQLLPGLCVKANIPL